MNFSQYFKILSIDKGRFGKTHIALKALAFFLVLTPITVVFSAYVTHILEQRNVLLSVYSGGLYSFIRGHLLFWFLLSGIIGPIQEELAFRLGMAQNRLIASVGIFFFVQLFLEYAFPLNLGHVDFSFTQYCYDKCHYLVYVPIAFLGSFLYYRFGYSRLQDIYENHLVSFYRTAVLANAFIFAFCHLLTN